MSLLCSGKVVPMSGEKSCLVIVDIRFDLGGRAAASGNCQSKQGTIHSTNQAKSCSFNIFMILSTKVDEEKTIICIET